jgi:HSP20 family protein
MLMRTDPFRELDRLAQQVFGTSARPAAMPINAFRKGEDFLVQFDLPGVSPDSIDLTVERNVLTVRAERRTPDAEGVELIASECPQGVFSRQLFLGDTLDTERIDADYRDGVLTVHFPVREQAKARKLSVNVSGSSSTPVGQREQPQVGA